MLFAGVGAAGAGFTILFHCCARRWIRYSLQDETVDVLLNHRIVFSIAYSRLTEVRVLTFWNGLQLLGTFPLINRVFGKLLLLRCADEVSIVLTPDDPEQFAFELQRRGGLGGILGKH